MRKASAVVVAILVAACARAVDDSTDLSTNVWRVTVGGQVEKYIENTGLHVVGAGVSTCAPVESPK